MIRKLKELSPLSATLALAAVIAVGAFAVGCGASDDDSSTVGASDSDSTAPDNHDDDDEHEDDGDGEDHHDDDDDDHAEVGESDVSAESFDDVAAVWAEVTKLKADLDGLIFSKDLVSVHKAAFAVRDHVNMLAEKSHDLSAGKQVDLARGVRTVASLAAELDEAGDDGKQAETEALNEKLQTVLNAIADLYPEGTLH